MNLQIIILIYYGTSSYFPAKAHNSNARLLAPTPTPNKAEEPEPSYLKLILTLLIYSYLNDSIGSNLDALLAGNNPNTTPINMENNIPPTMTGRETNGCQPAK